MEIFNTLIDKGALQRVEFVSFFQAFDGGDLFARRDYSQKI